VSCNLSGITELHQKHEQQKRNKSLNYNDLYFKRLVGVEPTLSAWKAEVIAAIRQAQIAFLDY
jgi:hypothetical protein